MISIIIASVNSDFLVNISQNIKDTIGVDFEIISFQNSNGEKGLCELYNLGAEKAKYEILCFMHEDIEVKTKDWGKKVIAIFDKENPGIVGVAGSTYKSSTPSGWFPPAVFGNASWRIHVEQDSKYDGRDRKHDYYNPKNESLSEVACIDGVWFCTTKTIALASKFDQDLLRGFHGYDIDFSLNVGRNHKIFVCFDILLYHASEGNFGTSWLKEMIKIHYKWNHLLPKQCNEFTNQEIVHKEKIALHKFFRKLIRNKDFSFLEVADLLSYYYKQNRIAIFQLWRFYVMAKLRLK